MSDSDIEHLMREVEFALLHSAHVEDGWLERVHLGDDMELFLYPDGVIRFLHPCLSSDGEVVMLAPKLNEAHVFDYQTMTVAQMLLCHPCGLKGTISHARWHGSG